MKRLLHLTVAVLTAFAYVLLPPAASPCWIESTTPSPNELPSTSGKVVVFNLSVSQDYECV